LENRSRAAGFTLLELIVAQSAGAVLLLIGVSAILALQRQSSSVGATAQALSDRALFKLQLQQTIERASLENVWVNAQVAANLHLPWSEGPSPVTGPRGAVFPVLNHYISGGALAVDPSHRYDAIYLVQKGRQTSIVTLDSSGQPDPSYVISAGQTAVTFNVTGSTAGFAPGDVVAVYAMSGLQMARVTGVSATTLDLDWSAYGTFQIGTAIQSWPTLYLTPGILIHPVQVSVVALDATSGFASIWSLDLTTGAYTSTDHFSYPLNSLKVLDPSGASPVADFLVLHANPFSVFGISTLGSGGQKVMLDVSEPL
jgi:type II secretory pathway pseudopilin PulG